MQVPLSKHCRRSAIVKALSPKRHCQSTVAETPLSKHCRRSAIVKAPSAIPQQTTHCKAITITLQANNTPVRPNETLQ